MSRKWAKSVAIVKNKQKNKNKKLDKSVAKCIEREQKTEKRKGVQNVATEIKNEAKV